MPINAPSSEFFPGFDTDVGPSPGTFGVTGPNFRLANTSLETFDPNITRTKSLDVLGSITLPGDGATFHNDIALLSFTRKPFKYFWTYGFYDQVVGTSGNDTITGAGTWYGHENYSYSVPDKIFAGDGNDWVAGADGGDPISGGPGNDTIYGQNGPDLILGGEGEDALSGGADNDKIYGGLGANIMDGGAGDDLLVSGSGDANDTLHGGLGVDTLYGGLGNDMLYSGPLVDQYASDELYGGSGDDVFIISDGSGRYTTGYSIDISASFPEDSNDTGWSDILYETFGVVYATSVPGVKQFGAVGKFAVTLFDFFQGKSADETPRQTVYTIPADWGNIAEVQVMDFNPMEDAVYLPLADELYKSGQSGVADTNIVVEFDGTVSTRAFTIYDNRNTNSSVDIASVNWDPDLVSLVPSYMTVNYAGEQLRSGILDAWGDSLFAHRAIFNGQNLEIGGAIVTDASLVGQEVDGEAITQAELTALRDSGQAFVQVGAYSGMAVYGTNLQKAWIGNKFDDVLGAFTPLSLDAAAVDGAYKADGLTLYGLDGHDVLFGGAGIDVIYGGNGIDAVAFYDAAQVTLDMSLTYDVTDSNSAPVTANGENLRYFEATATYSAASAANPDITSTDQVYEVENVIASGGDDDVTGDGEANVLYGLGGNDSLNGGAGPDTLLGGAGNDEIAGQQGSDELLGGEGDDLIWGGQLNGIAGDTGDLIIGGDGDDTLLGQHGNDTIYGDNQDGTGSGNDLIHGQMGDDTIYGGNGNDEIHGQGLDVIYGEAGNDSIYGGESAEMLVGGTGADTVQGGGGADTIVWNSGDGADTIDGGSGVDSLVVNLDDGSASTRTDMIISVTGSNELLLKTSVWLDTPSGSSLQSIETFTASGIEELVVNADAAGSGVLVVGDLSAAGVAYNTVHFNGGPGHDSFDGSGMTDGVRVVLDGAGGDDTLIGGHGDDIIKGGPDNDVKRGGPGADTFIGAAEYFVDTGAIHDFEHGDTLIIENHAHGTEIGDVDHGEATLHIDTDGDGTHDAGIKLYGDFAATEGHNVEVESSGDHVHVTLSAVVADAPITDGGPATSGGDHLYGSNEADTLRGRSGDDTVDGNGGDDRVYGGSGHDVLRGEDGDDGLHGGSGNDIIDGGHGDDLILGGSGDDTLEGEGGADAIAGGSGDDMLSGSYGDDSLVGGSGDDMVSGGEGADTIAGNLGDDTLSGDGGDDEIRGGKGDDMISGGGGVNLLWGDAGADNFVLEEGAESTNTIADFEFGEDLIGLAGGLQFADLDFAGEEILFNGSVLATLSDADTTNLSEFDFLIL